MVKSFLKKLILEERKIYLENHDDYANGFYIRDLYTLYGRVQDLRVPRVRGEIFVLPSFKSRRRANLDLATAVITLYAVGVNKRKISQFLESIYGFLLLTSEHFSVN